MACKYTKPNVIYIANGSYSIAGMPAPVPQFIVDLALLYSIFYLPDKTICPHVYAGVRCSLSPTHDGIWHVSTVLGKPRAWWRRG